MLATAALAQRLPEVTGRSAAPQVDTLIVSDIHLGLPFSRPRELLRLLEDADFKRLILLGDVFHDFSFRHLCADTWRLLAHIRRLSQRSDAEVVWVLGNHDRHLAPIVAALIGIETRESFRWSHHGRSFLALHGDRFDGFVSRNARLAEFFSGAYATISRTLAWLGDWPRHLDKLDVGIRRLTEEVIRGVEDFAEEAEADVIVCGHTHEPLHRVLPKAGPSGRQVEYFNTGGWVERPASFITVCERGVAIQRCH
ncbi:MAG: UDP-2,3-diacylglucosamine diphosphatase [Geminicoccaceae bacterium]